MIPDLPFTTLAVAQSTIHDLLCTRAMDSEEDMVTMVNYWMTLLSWLHDSGICVGSLSCHLSVSE